MEKPKQVVIVRHIRPVTIYSAPLVDNMYGATLYVELDYETRNVKFGYSICVGDNFSRKFGVDAAKIRFENEPANLPMPENGFEDTSVTAYIVENISETNVPVRNQDLLTAMWFAG